MFTTDEIIDLIRTGYIPPDPGRLGEFGRVLEALGERDEAIRADRDRLLKLTRRMEHEAKCDANMCSVCGTHRDYHHGFGGQRFCYLIRSDSRYFQPKECNCIKSRIEVTR